MNAENGARVIRVFVSSPSDVAPERGRVQAAAAKLNREYEGLARFDTVLWEEHFYKADRSFQLQIQKPEACEILVSIFWTRIGTELPVDFGRMPNGKPYPSGTAYELLTALAASRQKGIPDVYVFRKTADVALPISDAERRRQAQTQLEALEAFWSEWFQAEDGHFKAAFHTFTGTDEFESQIEELLRQWLQSRHMLGPRLKWPVEKGSPFPGLAAFEAEQSAVFFGRDRAIDEARRRLAAAAEGGTPFLLIVGPSGSGKSSLARAGLIPRLTTPGIIETIDLWRVARMKPSDGQAGPVTSLANALFAALPELQQGDFPNVAALADNLRRGGSAAARPIAGALTRLADAAQRERNADKPLRATLVLLIDQLEEFFAHAIADEERNAFADTLKELVATGVVWCIATLRADLYELLLKQPVLKTLKESGANFDLGPPGPAELAEIVRAPAAAAGLVFENSPQKGPLDERLLADAKTADSLPLLQFTLHQLYERRVEANGVTLLTHDAYEALGGLKGAIAAEAERAVAALPPGTLDALPRLLRQLAEPARDSKTLTLREVARADVSADSAEEALVQALLTARIIVAGNSAGRPTLRLAHDAVLTSWPQAASAAQASRDFYRVRAEVEEAVRRWQEHGQPKDRLIPRGVPLAEAEKLVADFARELPAELVAYVNASERQARLRQRLVAAAAMFFFVLAVGATGAGLWAYREQQRAKITLAAATRTANGLVFDLAQRFKNAVGVPATLVKVILDQARGLQEQLIKSGQVTPELKRSEAEALMETVNSLLTIGDTKGALVAAGQAQQIFTDLLKDDPRSTDYQRELSVAYNKLGDVQMAQGDLTGALNSYRQDYALAERLAHSNPGNIGWQRDLSVANERLGDIYFIKGNLAAALEQYRASLNRMVPIRDAHPTSTDLQRFTSVTMEKIGNIQLAQGKLAEALASYKAEFAIVERLAKSNPANADWQRTLAVANEKIGNVEVAQGILADALASYKAEFAILERLARSDPGNSDWQRTLAVSYEKIGSVEVAEGKLADALASYKAEFVILARLAKSDPSNAGWQHDLSVAYNYVGNVQMSLGDRAAAQQSYEADLAIMQRLAKSDPGNAGWQRDLSVAYEKVGTAQQAQGRLEDAFVSYRTEFNILERLAKSQPGNTDWQRTLAISYEKVGGVQQAQGKLADALASYQAEFAILDRLAKSDPGNADWQRTLAVSYEKVGNVQLALGNVTAALDSYRAEFVILDHLAQSDRGNAGWQRDLAVSYSKLAIVYLRARQPAQAQQSLVAGRAIIVGLLAKHPDFPLWRQDLSWFDRQIASLKTQ